MEDVKTFKRDIEKDTRRYKNLLRSWIGRMVDMAILTTVVYRIEKNPNEKTNTILNRNRKSNFQNSVGNTKEFQYSDQSCVVCARPSTYTPERKQLRKQRYHISDFRCVIEPKLSTILNNQKWRSVEQSRLSRYKPMLLQTPSFSQKC